MTQAEFEGVALKQEIEIQTYQIEADDFYTLDITGFISFEIRNISQTPIYLERQKNKSGIFCLMPEQKVRFDQFAYSVYSGKIYLHHGRENPTYSEAFLLISTSVGDV